MLADDQPIVRQGLRFIIGAQPDMEVTGEAGDGVEAVSLALKLKPDLVLMDIEMPGQSGIEATREIQSAGAGIKVMLLTTFDVQTYVAEGIRAGATGYLLKDSDTKTLLEGIRMAHRGSAIYHSTTASKALAQAMKTERTERDRAAVSTASGEPLTEKELEVLQMMAYGKRNFEIAETLHISEGTVKTHVHRILGKLQAADRTQAVVIAIRGGLVD
ncbi:response regulator [Paenibacillus humicola]|uniref:response regulator n=1 Tax=Paenibacillus humicola TaxID=3110540 RepID=UPI00237B3178|nr:response regulator transcription factor [Paenibacillus humicola]